MGSGEARPGGGPAGVGLLSRAPLLWEPREGGAKQLRKPCSRALEPFQAGPQRGGDEEPVAHPAQTAAAAGRLHCLTITRAGFSPRPAKSRDTSLSKIRKLLPQDQKRSLE
ncbi:Usher Syndrome Type-1G Protein [Manis pentadactyla]|nr:Usher Syndrome Type-1G Protein [Manis pentadactyla]